MDLVAAASIPPCMAHTSDVGRVSPTTACRRSPSSQSAVAEQTGNRTVPTETGVLRNRGCADTWPPDHMPLSPAAMNSQQTETAASRVECESVQRLTRCCCCRFWHPDSIPLTLLHGAHGLGRGASRAGGSSAEQADCVACAAHGACGNGKGRGSADRLPDGPMAPIGNGIATCPTSYRLRERQ